ncbi:hypothetical protein MNBD_ALPHA09-213 [hydrothermal vent metagenome]|uniref:Membrane transport protein MerF n=1 Tax=hydrothermal vent metagenome TaxID=652676 RepID=A0A3B0TSJ6_9ZZZZ
MRRERSQAPLPWFEMEDAMNDIAPKNHSRLLKNGISGSLIAAVCCFTPLLVIVFTGVGLTSYIGGIDYVVFPAMFASLGVTAYALYLRSGNKGLSPKPVIAVLVLAFPVLLIWLEFRYALRISLAAVALVAIYGVYLRPFKTPLAS